MTRTPARITRIARLDLRVEAGGWPEAEAHRAEIDADFARRTAANPHLWNGRVILMRDHAIRDGALIGRCIETDFAAFTWWRARGKADLGVVNVFSLAALEGADGAFVMGVMGDHTASPRQVYFPGGTPDPTDVADGRLDLAMSVVREMAEEVGLRPAEADAETCAESCGERWVWDVVEDGIYVCLMRRFVFAETGAALAARIRRFLSAETRPELKDVRVIAAAADLDAAVVPFAADYVRWRWTGQG
ncbi:NUDIX hydrolase [Aquabacter spiritensis]|uniref:Nudix hydrolase domain-containing protein n=1 Tax=Aquabacter spiritensis TaxID=933073 RepID=A0A4R3LQ03_9HYPH|nr:NUDIX hydrolase [Aquabacter spiritensis]TCT02573.1 hypothetical protein EDC64_1126 [Aquabacter spiritensis]